MEIQTKKPSLAQRANHAYMKLGVATTVAGLSVLSTAANAAEGDASLDVTAFTSGLTSVTANAKLIFAGALVVLALFVAWRYTKRGANSA